jgi:ribosomal protein S9
MKRATMNVQLTPDIRAILDEMATQQSTDDQQVFAADVIRQAIEVFLNQKGYDVEVKVNRGGYRGGPKTNRKGKPEEEN